MNATTKVILDTRTAKKDNTYPVKLRVTFNREQKYYPIGENLTEDEWKKAHEENPRKKNKENKLYFEQVEGKARDIIRALDVFSFKAFEKAFSSNPTEKKDLFVLMQEYIKSLKKEQRISTANSYANALSAFKEYAGVIKKRIIYLRDINPEFLLGFEKWKTSQGFSPSTVGIYMRSLRTIINIAIDKGDFSRDDYPFGLRKYQIPASRNIKKALVLDDIRKIVEYKPTSKAKERAKDMWLFSYLANGINMKDIALLQYKNINTRTITFVRSKTARSTKKDLKPIVVPILPELTDIIKKWGQEALAPDTFVFGIIDEADTLEQRLAKIKQFTKTINKYMKAINENELHLDINLTTYVARHSYATVLKRSGAPIELISENLGHKDLATTENYLDSFEDEIKYTYQKNLLNFGTTTNENQNQ